MKKNILIVANDFPYPPNHGGRVDIYEKICSLKSLGFNITLIATVKTIPYKEDIKHMEIICEHIFLINRTSSFLSLFSRLPYQVTTRANNKNLKRIKTLITNINFIYIILEGHYVYGLLAKLLKTNVDKKIFMRVHNNEEKYFRELSYAENSFVKSMFYKLESLKFKFFEKKIFSEDKISKLLHISYEEFQLYNHKYPHLENIFLPASVNINDMKEYTLKESPYVLFIGSMFMANNIEGLKWFLENIHIKLIKRFDNYKFIIAGNTKGINKKKTLGFLKLYTHIEFHDSPKTLDYLYNKSMIFINPMLSGAGVKLKTINAIKEALPVISTIVGNEGTGLQNNKNIMVSNNTDSYLKYISILIKDENKRKFLVANAQKFLKNNYNLTKNLQDIIK